MPLAYILQSPTPRDAWSRMAPPKATCGHGWLCLCAHLPGSTKGHEVKCASRSSHQEPPRPCLTPQALPPFGSEHVLLAPPGHLRRGSHNLTILPFFLDIFSLLQTVPSAVMDKGKAIADAYRTPADDYVDGNAARGFGSQCRLNSWRIFFF
jgi:hypothetical protein